MRALMLAALILAAPLVMARPTSWHLDEETWEEVYRGIATQGSADDFLDWWGDEISCTQSLIEIWMELRVRGGAPDDTLVLEAPGSSIAVGQPWASQSVPAVVYAEQSDGCPDFVVRGADVATEAPYELRITYHGLCLPTPCANGPTNTVGRLV